jgi:hypothetical protein
MYVQLAQRLLLHTHICQRSSLASQARVPRSGHSEDHSDDEYDIPVWFPRKAVPADHYAAAQMNHTIIPTLPLRLNPGMKFLTMRLITVCQLRISIIRSLIT